MSPKQRLQLEVADINEDSEHLAAVHPNAGPIIARVRDILDQCVHLMDGADVQELCDALYRGGQNN